jgi:hypothetical protein
MRGYGLLIWTLALENYHCQIAQNSFGNGFFLFGNSLIPANSVILLSSPIATPSTELGKDSGLSRGIPKIIWNPIENTEVTRTIPTVSPFRKHQRPHHHLFPVGETLKSVPTVEIPPRQASTPVISFIEPIGKPRFETPVIRETPFTTQEPFNTAEPDGGISPTQEVPKIPESTTYLKTTPIITNAGYSFIPDMNKNTTIIIASAAGSSAFVILLIVICCYKRNKRRKKYIESQKHFSSSTNDDHWSKHLSKIVGEKRDFNTNNGESSIIDRNEGREMETERTSAQTNTMNRLAKGLNIKIGYETMERLKSPTDKVMVNDYLNYLSLSDFDTTNSSEDNESVLEVKTLKSRGSFCRLSMSSMSNMSRLSDLSIFTNIDPSKNNNTDIRKKIIENQKKLNKQIRKYEQSLRDSGTDSNYSRVESLNRMLNGKPNIQI